MQRTLFRCCKVHLDVTDDRLTDHGGLALLMGVARHLGLFPCFGQILKRKRHQRGASDIEVLKRHVRKQDFEYDFTGLLRVMNLHHAPIAPLAVNQVYYLRGLIAQMLLKFSKYRLLPTDARDVGLRPLIRNLM